MKILIAEDDAVARRVLALFLSPYGEVDAASTGEIAISMFEGALSSNTPYGLICLDIHMPGLEGLEVLEKIRSIEQSANTNHATPVFMLTGSSEDEEVDQAKALGARGFILKPIIESELVDHLMAIGVPPSR